VAVIYIPASLSFLSGIINVFYILMGDVMKDIILKYLKGSKEYVSGEDISKALNISRTAVWKYINILKDEGYVIESSSKRGYMLVSSPDNLSFAELEPYLKTKYLGKKIVYLNSTTSTNDIAKSMAAQGEGEGLVVIAEEQLSGRGRMGRRWLTGKREAIAATILLRPAISPQDAASLTPVLALSIVKH
jgi:BirA family biotin operon repressor/biotin-[acetyl-CoA-carboxylase] ligase